MNWFYPDPETNTRPVKEEYSQLAQPTFTSVLHEVEKKKDRLIVCQLRILISTLVD